MTEDPAKDTKATSIRRWILDILGIGTPVLVAVLGWYLSRDIEASRLQIEQNAAEIGRVKAQSDLLSAQIQQRIEKVQVIKDFLEALTGKDETAKRLAIKAVLIAIPDEAPDLLEGITVGSPDADIAHSALDARRTKLAEGLFSSDKSMRLTALTALRSGWRGDPAMVDIVARRAQQGDPNSPGVIDALLFLNDARSLPEGDDRAAVLRVAQGVKGTDPAVAQAIKDLIARLK